MQSPIKTGESAQKYSPNKSIARRRAQSPSKARELSENERNELISRKITPKMQKHKASNIPIKKTRLAELAVSGSNEKKNVSKIPVPRASQSKQSEKAQKPKQVEKPAEIAPEAVEIAPEATPPKPIETIEEATPPPTAENSDDKIIPLSPANFENEIKHISVLSDSSTSENVSPMKIKFEEEIQLSSEEEEYHVEELIDNTRKSDEFLVRIDNIIDQTLKLADTTPAGSMEVFDLKIQNSDDSEVELSNTVFNTDRRDSIGSFDEEVVEIKFDNTPRSPFTKRK